MELELPVFFLLLAAPGLLQSAAGPPPDKNGVCTTWGLFHFKTFDGEVYYFPVNCTYLFSSDCKNTVESFSISLRRAIIDMIPTVSYITVNLNGELFTISKNAVSLDGNMIQLPYRSPWIEIHLQMSYVQVLATIGFSLIWNQEDRIHLELDKKFANQTCGLCGPLNGYSMSDDFFSNGVQLSPYAYGLLQKVEGPTETCNDAPELTEDPCHEVDAMCVEMFNNKEFFSCHLLVDAIPYLEACIQDQCRCKSIDCLNTFSFCSTVEEYSRQCAERGGKPFNWRTPDICPKECPLGMEYKECGPQTAKSCSNLGVDPFYTETCLDGCFCVQDTVLDDISGNGCIEPDQCHCIYNGVIYPAGGVYSNSCYRCECRNGQWVCVELSCPGFCSIEGGSHITTFDELMYNFHGQCMYVLSKVLTLQEIPPVHGWDPLFPPCVVRDAQWPCADSSFIVMGELIQCGQTDMETCLTTVTVVIYNSHIIDIDAAGNVLVNGDSVQLPFTGADFSIFEPTSFFIIVNLNMGLLLQIQLVPIMQLYIQVQPSFHGELCGLCGNFNHIQGDEFTDTSGMVQGTASAFGNSWRSYAPCPEVKNVHLDPCHIQSENAQYAYEWCDLLTSMDGPFAACHYRVNPAPYYKKCLFDTCVCNENEECLCAAISSYVRACAMKGVILTDWRTNVCSKYATDCSNAMVYNYVVSSCQPSCASLSEPDGTCGIQFVPVDGCVCPNGLYLDDSGICVHASQCPCCYQGSAVPSGTTVNVNGVQCTCTEGQLKCTISEDCIPPKTYFNCSSVPPGTPGSECQKSCHSVAIPCFSRLCISGCMCPENMVLNGHGDCVPAEQCPCVYNGVSYQSGTKIQVNCNTCTCIKEMWNCTNMDCLGSCTTYGEGNFITFDNRRYNFSGSCQYILAQDFCGNPYKQSTFRVIIENVPCSSSGRTCSRSASLYLGTYRFTFRNAQFTVVKTHSGVSLTYKIRNMGIFLVVEGSNGMLLVWDKKTTIYVKLKSEFMGSVCGLCGNYDGNSVNDFITHRRSVVEDVVEFGNSWKVSPFCQDAEPPLDSCQGNPGRQYWAQNQCNLILSSVFSKCHLQIDPVPYYDICVSDSCGCGIGGDCECFCTAVAAYAQACIDSGVCVYWRSPEICPLFCDYYNHQEECEWHYKPCGAPCMKTCRNPSGECLYVLPGLEGCYPTCPPERPYFDEDRSECAANCGCNDNEGNHYEYGENVDMCKNCHSCYCDIDGIACVYDVKACFCIYNGLIYKYGALISSTKDSKGLCVDVTCGADGNLDTLSYPCLSTSTTTYMISSSGPASTSTPESTSTPTLISPTQSTTTKCVYEVCEWSSWFDVSYPKHSPSSGDFETFENIKASGYEICDSPIQVTCRAKMFPDTPLEELKQTFSCNVTFGLVCYNKDQPSGLCDNYEIKMLCCWNVQKCTSTPSLSSTEIPTASTGLIPTSTSTSTSPSSTTACLCYYNGNTYLPGAIVFSHKGIDGCVLTGICNMNCQIDLVLGPKCHRTTTVSTTRTSTSTSATTHTKTTPSTTTTTACLCYYNGKTYFPGAVVFSHNGIDGCVLSGICNMKCQIDLVLGPMCHRTTTVSTTRTSTSTSATTHTTTTPSTTTTTACLCYYNGKTYFPGNLVFRQDGNNGCVLSGYCNMNCQMHLVPGPKCHRTTTVSTTRTSTSTSATTHTTTTPSKTTTTACLCYYNGKTYFPGPCHRKTTVSTTSSSTTKPLTTPTTTSHGTATSQRPPFINIINCTNAVCQMYGNYSLMTVICPLVIPVACAFGVPPIKVYDPDQCCYHFECRHCTGPDGRPKLPGESWICNCKQCICTRSYTVECVPLFCVPATKALCNKEGFENVRVPATNGACCPTIECRCNPNLCRRPLHDCDVGFQFNIGLGKGDCCASYNCVPKDVCVVKGIEYPPLSPILSEVACKECYCTAEQDPRTQLNIVSCEPISCNNTCPLGYWIVKMDGKCCGICVQVACVIYQRNGTAKILKPRETWKPPGQNCTVYRCDHIGSTFILVVIKTICAPFAPKVCVPGTIKMTPDGCCLTCKVNVIQPCQLLGMSDVVSVGHCNGTIDIGYCSGSCIGSSMYDVKTMKMVHKCSCCTEKKISKRTTELKCANGKSISYSYITVLQCGCVNADCIH